MATETLDISEARKRFNTLDRQLQDDPVIVITRHNKKAFAVINIDYLETLMETMEVLSDPEAVKMLEESMDAVKRGDLIDQKDVEEDLW